MEAQGSPPALLPLPQSGVFVASLLLRIPWRSQSHHQTPPKGSQMTEELYPSPWAEGKNHPSPNQQFVAFPREMGRNLANSYLPEAGSSRLSTSGPSHPTLSFSCSSQAMSSSCSNKYSPLKVFTNATAHICNALPQFFHNPCSKSCLKLTSSRKFSSS